MRGLLLSCLLLLFPSTGYTQQWSFTSKIDPVEGTRVATASVTSTRGSSYVRCKDGLLETFFAPWFAYIGQDSAEVRYRFSGDEVQAVTWSVSTNGTAVFADDPVYFARELARASSLAMDVYDFNGTPNRVSIPLAGSRVAITRVFAECKLPITDPSISDENMDFRVAASIDSLSIEGARELAEQLELRSAPVRSIALYQKLSDIYNFIALEGCLHEKSTVYSYDYCLSWREERKTDPDAIFPLWPFKAIEAFDRAQSRENTSVPPTPPPIAPTVAKAATSICTEPSSQASNIRPFNIERAYPQRAIDRGQEGAVSATLQISNTGDVVGVVITSENPPGVFGSAFDREARRMKFSPARQNCENISSTVYENVKFSLPADKLANPPSP